MDSKPTNLSGRPTLAKPHRPVHLWIILALAVAVICVFLTLCALVTSQIYLELALALTPTPTATHTITAMATLTPIPAGPATPPSATVPHAPTITKIRPSGPTATLARSSAATRTPTSVPTVANLTFKFDAGVSPQERSLIQKGMTFAQSQLGDIGPVTIIAYSNLDDLAAEADKFYGRSAGSSGSVILREMFSNGKWLANGGSGAISIWVSGRWLKLSSAFKQKTLVHEYYHNVQAVLSRKSVTHTGPIWLYEGAADVVAFAAVVDTGAFTSEQIHADKITQSRGMLSPLSSIITLQDAEAEDTEDPYQLGYLAVEYLTSPLGDKRLGALNKFWQTLASGATWQESFRNTFGLTVTDFYNRFEAYRSAEFPPYCGQVGVPLSAATPAPRAVRFARQLMPGDMPRTEMPWADPPNIPYVFCATGTKLPWLSSSAYRFPARYAGWVACGANCIAIFMRPTDPEGQYSFAINLPDGYELKTSFDHRVPGTVTTPGRQ